jgi:hypothetical protein
MRTTIKVERHPTHLRLVVEDAKEGENETIARHWDLTVLHALQVALQLLAEVTKLIASVQQQRQAQPQPNGGDTAPTPDTGDMGEPSAQG